MAISADTLRRLGSLRLDADQMAGILDILADFQAADETRRERQRDRTRRHRDAKRDGNVTVTQPVTLPPPKKKGLPPNPPLKKNTPSLSVDDARALEDDFGEWYAEFPNKVGKPAAQKAYLASRKRGATQADLLTGLSRYILTKPPDRPWCNPATWLNQDRQNDQPAPDPPRRPARSGPVIDHSPNEMRGRAHGFADRDAQDDGGLFAEQAALRRRQFAERRTGGEDYPA